MYDDLVKQLWECASGECFNCSQYTDTTNASVCSKELMKQAADAIEELSKPKWIMFESRPMDDEERKYYSEHYGYDLDDHEAVIYCCQLPEHGQEVLVCNEYGYIRLDTFEDDPDYGVGFETNGDMEGLVAWMPLPQPPKEDKA